MPIGDRSGAIGSRYYNRAAFANPAPGTFGNAGFRNFEGPGNWQWDVALSRTFQFQEDQRIEIRAEAYNVTNSVRLDGSPGSVTVTSGTFGLVRTQDVRDMRILQFAAKWVFRPVFQARESSVPEGVSSLSLPPGLPWRKHERDKDGKPFPRFSPVQSH